MKTRFGAALLGAALGLAVPARAQVESVEAAASGAAARPVLPAPAPGGALPALSPAPALQSAPPAASSPALGPAPAPSAAAPAASPARAALDRLYFGPEAPSRPLAGHAAQVELGVLERPAEALTDKTLPLDQWRWLSFVVSGDAGEPTVNGRPAAESPLEFKSLTGWTGSGETARRWTRYSWLALGATPAGRYEIAFPGFEFSIEVIRTDFSTPEERLASAHRAIAETFGKAFAEDDDAERLPFGPSVPETVRLFLPSHLSLRGRELRGYEKYLDSDPFPNERERDRRRGELEKLKAFYADAVSGARPFSGLSPLIAQLLAREDSILSDLRRRMSEDPGMGRAAAELFVRQLDSHRSTLRGAHALHAQAEALPRPGPFSRLLGRAAGWWARRAFRRAAAGAADAAARRAAEPRSLAAGPAPSLRVSPELEPAAAAFVRSAHARVEAIVPGLSRYLVADEGLSEDARAEKLRRLAYLQDFLALRAAGEGFPWSVPAMMTHLRGSGGEELAADYASYLEKDGSLARAERRRRRKDAAALAAFLAR